MAHKWAIHVINGSRSFLYIFKDIKNGTTCGQSIDLSWTEEEAFQTFTLNSNFVPYLEQMAMAPSYILCTECAVEAVDGENSDAMGETVSVVTTQKAKTPQTSLVETLMRRKDSYLCMKTSSNPTADILQYNGLISYLKKHQFGVAVQNL